MEKPILVRSTCEAAVRDQTTTVECRAASTAEATNSKDILHGGWLDSARRSLQCSGLTDGASTMILNSIRDSTKKQYTSYINRFLAYIDCDVFNVSHSNVINFLQYLFADGLSYSVINTAASAVKFYLEIVGHRIEWTLIERYKKGCFNVRPSLPRHTDIWDPDIVLSYLAKNASCVELPFLTKKCVTLLALVSSQRVSTIHSIGFSDVSFTESKVSIAVTSLQKQSRPGFHQGVLTFEAYEDSALCIVASLRQYLAATSAFRGCSQCTALFLTYGKPVKNASKDSISRWIKDMIHTAGVPSVFTAHSTRAASVSKKFRDGIDVMTILKHAGWSTSCSFHKFYNKNLLN